jgi:hypothetical protein
MVLNGYWVTEEIREEIKHFLESNENEDTIYHNPWDTARAVLRGKFRAVSAYINKREPSQISNLMIHLKLLEKTKINETSNYQTESNNKHQGQKSIQRIKETKSWFIRKIKKIDKLLANMTKQEERDPN